MQGLDQLTAMIADEIAAAPQTVRTDLALQVASSMVELCAYELARTGPAETSTRLFLLANEIERLRRAAEGVDGQEAMTAPFIPRATATPAYA
jgi:hypothetical protein